MTEPIITCPLCDGSGINPDPPPFPDSDVCPRCNGAGEVEFRLPQGPAEVYKTIIEEQVLHKVLLTEIQAKTVNMPNNLAIVLDDMSDRLDDIMDKCNDIFEKVSE